MICSSLMEMKLGKEREREREVTERMTKKRTVGVGWVGLGGRLPFATMLAKLQRGDPSIPAGRIRSDDALVLADRDAARELDPTPM